MRPEAEEKRRNLGSASEARQFPNFSNSPDKKAGTKGKLDDQVFFFNTLMDAQAVETISGLTRKFCQT
jgi:hypothetical protein